jgi:DNA-binding CsgD family transcriptional regulator/tetratricopeptide (TPR) repeat protein
VELLERGPLLASLREFQAAAAGGAGCLVFVAGEAGIGKTALVRSFCEGLAGDVGVYRGFCDSLATPRALGPLHDIARAGLDGLAAPLAAGHDRHALFTTFFDLIGAAPSVTVIEDAHWADEATLDLLLFVGRRVCVTPAMVVVTYRSEDVGREHPLRRVLGDLATAASVRRLTVPALTAAAVAVLAEPAGRDGAQLRALTGGNPFFVTEALSVAAKDLPTTVRDAVLARASRLSAAARSVLDVISLVPDRAEVALLEPVAAAVAAPVAALDEGIHSGMVVHEGTTVRFRHELARRVVEADVPAARAAILHARILTHLAAMETVDPARLSFHAEAAGDPAAVLRYAPLAGQQAAGLGAHREAAAHYERALRFAADATTVQKAELWERRADECDRTGDLTEALTASAQAVALWHAAGEIEREASVRARRTNTLWNAGRDIEAHESACAAVALLEHLPPTPELAQAYAALAMRLMHERDYAGAIAMGEAAIPHARRIGDDWVLAWALVAVGSSHWLSDTDRAVELLTAALAAARRAGNDLATAGVLCALGKGAAETRRYDLAETWLGDAVAWCTERDLDSMRSFALAWQARCHMEQGRWVEAMGVAAALADAPALHVPGQIQALTVVGRLRARRGDPDAQAPLDRAWDLAERTGDLDSLWPAAAGRAECAWLTGYPKRIKTLVADTYRLAVRLDHPWATGELGYWLWMVDAAPEATAPAALPWMLQLGGDWRGAAKIWADLGCPYESAVARSHADTNQQLAALQELHQMGAWPAAELLARTLRQGGVRNLPRPARRTTLHNPAQLTDRQIDVLGLLADGLPNADIAARLYISPRTVDHHVSAILAKLGVDSRRKAAQWEAARRAQLTTDDAPQVG